MSPYLRDDDYLDMSTSMDFRSRAVLSGTTGLLAEGRQAELPQPTLCVREIDGLTRDFATMATAIEHCSHNLRDFAAATSHELKPR